MNQGKKDSILSRFVHLAAALANWQGNLQFKRAFKQVEKVQRQQLQRLLTDLEGTETAAKFQLTPEMSWESFKENVPVTEYDDWSDPIDRQRNGKSSVLSKSPCERYQPTSGSTSKVKWIPYTKAFLKELDGAISPMMSDMYRQFPGIRKGKHYWSLSWIPTELRSTLADDINNDLNLLPWWKRLFMTLSNAVPESTAMASTSDDSMFATLCYLLSDRELSFLSVWSPTFALTMLDAMVLHQKELSLVLMEGQWGSRSENLKNIPCPQSVEAAQLLLDWDGELSPDFLHKLWPNLGLISAWDTSTSAIWAEQLQDLFPNVSFQGKGLWATEGVVTIPWQNKYPLALRSHFYEFLDIKSGKVYPSWGLHIGQEVRPVLTTGSGLLRYAMKDRIKVVDYINRCPCFEFLGRIDGIDMVGEKLSPEVALDIIRHIKSLPIQDSTILPISLIAVTSNDAESVDRAPFYLLLCEVSKGTDPARVKSIQENIGQLLEKELRKHFHYSLARDLGQLSHAKVYCSKDARKLYVQRGAQKGMITGNIKVEPLVLWDNNIPEPIQHELNTSKTASETPVADKPEDANELAQPEAV